MKGAKNDNGFVLMLFKDLRIIKHNSELYTHFGDMCYSAEILNEYAEKFAISLFDFYYAAIQKSIKKKKGVNVMNRDNLRKVEVRNNLNRVEFIAYFHEIYKDTSWNGGSRPCAILELENGEMMMVSLGSIKFIS